MTGDQPQTDRQLGAGIEVRSIDHVPEDERHGTVWPLTAVWVAGNANIGTVAVGAVGIAAGTSLTWTLVAVVLGCAFGTVFSALHSTQGPHLGLPQLIQSRPQFGYRGAVLVFVLALITYVGFQVFVNLLGAQSLSATTQLGTTPGIVVVGVASGLIALFGYNWIHQVSRLLSVVFIAVFLVLTVVLVSHGGLHLAPGRLEATPFLLQFGAAAGYQINWAIYVSDYTRYLPREVSPRAMFWCTYLGMTVSSAWLAALGAVLTSSLGGSDAITQTMRAGSLAFHGFATTAILVSLLGLVTVGAMNTYGGALTLISTLDCFTRLDLGRRIRVVTTVVVTATAIILARFSSGDFLASFSSFLTLLLYLFAPWTAINLTDYFWVRRRSYSINDIFRPDGIYGSWNARGLTAYAIGFAVEVPFMHLTWFTGPIATALGGADLAPFVGLVAGLVAYTVLFARERRDSLPVPPPASSAGDRLTVRAAQE